MICWKINKSTPSPPFVLWESMCSWKRTTAAIVRGLKEIFKPVVFLVTSESLVFVANLRWKANEDEVTVVQFYLI